MTDIVKVGIVGATGRTGRSIVNGLIQHRAKFEIFALVRPESLKKPATEELETRGVSIIPANLEGPEEELAEAISGIDVLISVILGFHLEIPLANAAKRAGVKRFIPSCFGPVMPPKGILTARELKEDVISHVLKLHLPYTIIDVGAWYQASLFPIPSGRLDYCVPPGMKPTWNLGLDGNVPCAVTDISDVGRYVAKIIVDPRTLNKRVFAYNQVLTRNQIYNVVEALSGEVLNRIYVTEEEALEIKQQLEKNASENPGDIKHFFAMSMAQYFLSWGIRGDNVPEYARYLGYLDYKDLYPHFEYTPFEEYVKDALEGKAEPLMMEY